eukprot:7101158-Lingulodinium_polyedra.AAC.1
MSLLDHCPPQMVLAKTSLIELLPNGQDPMEEMNTVEPCHASQRRAAEQCATISSMGSWQLGNNSTNMS